MAEGESTRAWIQIAGKIGAIEQYTRDNEVYLGQLLDAINGLVYPVEKFDAKVQRCKPYCKHFPNVDIMYDHMLSVQFYHVKQGCTFWYFSIENCMHNLLFLIRARCTNGAALNAS